MNLRDRKYETFTKRPLHCVEFTGYIGTVRADSLHDLACSIDILHQLFKIFGCTCLNECIHGRTALSHPREEICVPEAGVKGNAEAIPEKNMPLLLLGSLKRHRERNLLCQTSLPFLAVHVAV